MTDRETTQAALTLLELHKGDMGRTKVPPKASWTHSSRTQSTSYTTSNASGITVRDDEPILEDTAMTSRDEPKTPRAIGADGTVQPGPYPTPVSAAQQPSKSQKKAQRKDNPSVKSSIKYGKWSPSGRSWFVNRQSVPGDRPPPPGANYSYRPVYLNKQPRSPTPQERHSSVVSSVDSEPIIARPRRRRLYRRSDALADKTAEAGPNTVSEAEDSDASGVESNPIIIRRQRRPLSPIKESRSPNPTSITVGSYLTQQSRDSPFRETSLASDLYEGVQNRVRRRNRNLRRSNRLNPRSRESSATPPVATRIRRMQGTTIAAPSRLRSGTVRKNSIKLEASEPEEEAEETTHESSEQSEDPTELKSEGEEAVLKRSPRKDRPPRPSRQRPSPQPSASWVRRSQRSIRAGPKDLPRETVEPGRMTLDEWVNEENVLKMTPPYLSSGSEYEGG